MHQIIFVYSSDLWYAFSIHQDDFFFMGESMVVRQLKRLDYQNLLTKVNEMQLKKEDKIYFKKEKKFPDIIIGDQYLI